MGIFDRFPYSSTHEMNLDFMLGKAQEINQQLQTVQTGMQEVQTGLSQISEQTERATTAAAAAEAARDESQQNERDAFAWTEQAEHHADRAEAALSQMTDDADRAEAAAQNASNSATAAASSADIASQNSARAAQQAANAQLAAHSAQGALNQATVAANNAQTSATSAADAAALASGYNSQAATSATNAATSATNAAASVTSILGTEQNVQNLVESIPEDYTTLSNDVDGLKSTLTLINDGNKDCLLGAKFYDGYYNSSDVYTGTKAETLGKYWGVVVVPVPIGETITISGFTANNGTHTCWLNSSDPSDVNSFAWNSNLNNSVRVCKTGWLGISDYNYIDTKNNLKVTYGVISAVSSRIDKCLKPAFAEFSSIGNANNLELNQTYLVYGHDVASGTNLPEGLSVELDAWPAYIYTMQSTSSKGFQIIVSSNNIFFRTVSISNGAINSGSTWRQLNNNQTAEKETSKAIEDATENALQTFETSDLYSSVNGAYLAKAIETDSIDCTPSTIYGVHESNIYIYNGYIYILCSTNKTDGAEDQTKYNIELIKTSLDGTPVLNTPVCSVGDTILGNTISKCQASFILPIGDKIHIYVDVGISTMYKIFHTVYDIGTNTFSSFDEVYYVNSSGNTVEAKTSGEQYICNHWFSYDGNDYCTAVYFLRTECGVAYTDDFTTFKFIARVSVDENIIGGEMTAEYVGYYGFDKLVIAYRTANNKRNCVFQQYDCTTGTWERKNYIPDATARPMFFKLDNELYLANNAPYTRYDISIWHYITANNWNNMGTLEPVAVARLGIPCTYFSFCMHNNNLYMIGICNNLTKVKVAVIEPETKSKAQINSTLLSLFT